MKNFINYRPYGDLQNTAYIPVSASIDDCREMWLSKGNAPEGQDAELIAIYHDAMVVKLRSEYRILNLIDGKKRCIVAGENNRFQMVEDGIVNINQFSYELIDMKGQKSKISELGLAPFNQPYFLLCMVDKKASYANFTVNNSYPHLGDEGPTTFSFSRGSGIDTSETWKSFKLQWSFQRPDQAYDALLTKDGLKCVIASPHYLYIIPVNAKDDKDVLIIKTIGSRGVSLQGEHALVLCSDIQGVTLKKINLSGPTVWALPFKEKTKVHQPPAIHPDGTLYCLIDDKVVCVNNGDIQWEYEVPYSTGNMSMTVLDNGSMLVACATQLLQISADGHLISTFSNPFLITCRPIADSDGKIYVAGDGNVRCLKGAK